VSFETVVYEMKDGVAGIRLNRPLSPLSWAGCGACGNAAIKRIQSHNSSPVVCGRYAIKPRMSIHDQTSRT